MDDALLFVALEDHAGIDVVRLVGELDISTIPLGEVALRAMRHVTGPLVIDLSGLEFASLRGTRMLAAELGALRSMRPVDVIGVPQPAARVAELLGLDRALRATSPRS